MTIGETKTIHSEAVFDMCVLNTEMRHLRFRFRFLDYLWFIPLACYMLLRVFWQNLQLLFEGAAAVLHHFSILLFFSPDYDLWLSILFSLVMLPWVCLLLILALFDSSAGTYAHRYR